jgi:hypothetical protein
VAERIHGMSVVRKLKVSLELSGLCLWWAWCAWIVAVLCVCGDGCFV